MADPKFVRLADHLTRGGRYDLVSGWGISGYDVVEMPDKDERPNAFRFVKGELAAGRLEGASKAEYDEAHPDIAGDLGYKTTEGDDDSRPYQEAEVQRAAAKVHRKVKARRSSESEEDAADADEERRKALLERQKEGNKGPKKSAAKKAAARKAVAERDDDEDDDDEDDDSDDDGQGDGDNNQS